MRIDVDVYKGPLANHEDVQVQQFAAMAIGAKPLLEQLACNLASAGNFTHARRVGEVLSLYRDLKPIPDLESYLARTEDMIGAYAASMRVLVPNRKFAAERLDRISAKFLTKMEVLDNLGIDVSTIDTKESKAVFEAYQLLRDEYREIPDFDLADALVGKLVPNDIGGGL